MPSHRMERTTEDIRREITAILREVGPACAGLISVVRRGHQRPLLLHGQVSAMEGLSVPRRPSRA
ncbi:MAG: hypothetical protein ACLSB9_38655 [Hydrogeniiclostridium mannosilyticum]